MCNSLRCLKKKCQFHGSSKSSSNASNSARHQSLTLKSPPRKQDVLLELVCNRRLSILVICNGKDSIVLFAIHGEDSDVAGGLGHTHKVGKCRVVPAKVSTLVALQGRRCQHVRVYELRRSGFDFRGLLSKIPG